MDKKIWRASSYGVPIFASRRRTAIHVSNHRCRWLPETEATMYVELFSMLKVLIADSTPKEGDFVENLQEATHCSETHFVLIFVMCI